MDMKGLKAFGLSQVKLQDAYFVNAYEKEVLYLTGFETKRLLAGFRETAGVDMQGAVRYPGWENMLIGGHTLGHYMTACVKSYESANCNPQDRKVLLRKIKHLLVGLKECQDALGTGFVFGAVIQDKNNVELQFDYVEQGKTNIITEAWVPWYTMHKIFEGLVSAANMDVELLLSTSPDGVDKMEVEYVVLLAKEVASKLADWTYGRTSVWSEETHRTVLSIEYGGMNDCLYDVYRLTGKAHHLEAAHAFDQVDLFEKVYRGKPGDNVLNNHHANTTIPKFLGALKRFVVTGDKAYFGYAVDFWNKVTGLHSYVTGGNSEWEHFGEDRILDKERTNCNCETCNSYNMLKMTKLLFMLTGDVKYADWYENTFLNSILSSQNPKTGMTTYFQPMASGYFKTYSEPFTKFWCCTGSGMENFSKLQESFYFYKEDALVINQYISSRVAFRGYEVEVAAELPEKDTVEIRLPEGYEGKLLLRLPGWLSKEAEIAVNGVTCKYAIVGRNSTDVKGYTLLEGCFEAGSIIAMQLPMQVVAYNLPDGKDTYGFKYGPVVLSALLGDWNMEKGMTGVDVTIPTTPFFGAEYLPTCSEVVSVEEGTVKAFAENAGKHMQRLDGKKLAFKLSGIKANLTYVTHYKQHEERYGIYFKFRDADSEMSGSSEEKYRKLDTVQPGYGQYESDILHQMKEEGVGTVGITNDGTRRYAKAGGSFSYTMMVEPEMTVLQLTLRHADAGKSLVVSVGDEGIYEAVVAAAAGATIDVADGSVKVAGETAGEYYQVEIPVPKEVLRRAQSIEFQGKEVKVLTFAFSGSKGENGLAQESAAVCQFIYTLGKKAE